MKHKCPRCKIIFECPIDNCDGNQYHYCSKICKDVTEKKKEIQTELTDKLFPDGRWL